MQRYSLKYFSCNQDQASMELNNYLQSSSLSTECSESTNSCSAELVIGRQNTTKVYTSIVVGRLQAARSPMQMQATQLITRAVDDRSELVIGLQNCINLFRCTKVVQQETDCTASGAMTLARRDTASGAMTLARRDTASGAMTLARRDTASGAMTLARRDTASGAMTLARRDILICR